MTPTADQLAWARAALGCEHETDPDGWVSEWCDYHARMPCRLAEELAAKLAEREAQVRADECEQISRTFTAMVPAMRADPVSRRNREWKEGALDATEEAAVRLKERAKFHRTWRPT